MYDQCVYSLLNVSILGNIRDNVNVPLARTLSFKRTYRTKSTWRTPDTILGEFCNFLNSNVRHPRRVRHFLRFLMTNDYANFDLDLLNVHNVGALRFLIKSTWPETYDM